MTASNLIPMLSGVLGALLAYSYIYITQRPEDSLAFVSKVIVTAITIAVMIFFGFPTALFTLWGLGDPVLFVSPGSSFLLGLLLPIALEQLLFGQFGLSVESKRVEKLEATISKAEQAVEKEPEKTKPVWDLSRAQLELYINRNLSQVRNIFWITIVVMAAGFGMVVFGVYRALDAQLHVAVLTTASGLITQTIGATFLLIYRSTMKQANAYVATLERINAVGMAVAIVDLIPDEKSEAKTKARVDLVKQILSGQTRRASTKES
jgi:uncharacterized membrane protein YesL